MKNILKMNSILSGIFMTACFVLIGKFASGAANAEDPNLAASAPSGTMEAASAAASGAATARPAASGASATNSTTPQPPIQIVQAKVAKPLAPDEYSRMHFAVSNLEGVMLEKGEPRMSEDVWGELDRDSSQHISLDKKQYFDFTTYTDGSEKIVTFNKKKGRATVTIFKGQVPDSFTIVGPNGEYTATARFCEILRVQTNSKNFRALADTAKTCNAFYKRRPMTPQQEADMQAVVNAHRENIATLKESPAKEIVKDRRQSDSPGWVGFKGTVKETIGFGNNGVLPARPRPVLSKMSSTEEAQDRLVISELAEACGTLWVDNSGADLEPPRPKAAPAKKATTVK